MVQSPPTLVRLSARTPQTTMAPEIVTPCRHLMTIPCQGGHEHVAAYRTERQAAKASQTSARHAHSTRCRLGGDVMADDALEDLVRRLTALVVKLDERDDHILALLEEQREFNRQQVQINARLEILVTEMFRQRTNGREA